jgi:hypothetical protein
MGGAEHRGADTVSTGRWGRGWEMKRSSPGWLGTLSVLLSPPLGTGIKSLCCSACLISFLETEFYYVVQAGLELLGTSNLLP